MKRILLVSVDKIVIEFVSEILDKEDYVLETAASSTSVIDIFSEKKIDLVLMDLDIPETERNLTLSFLKSKELKYVPIVILGDASNETQIIELLEDGFSDCFMKPVSGPLLLAKIKKWIKHTASLRDKDNQLILFKSIADFSNNLESFRNAQNEIIYCSPSVERILGYTHDEYINKINLLEIIHPDDLNEAVTLFERMMAGDAIESHVFRLFNKNNELVWMDGSAQPVWSDSGEFIGFRISIRDITHLKEVELSLAESRARYKLISDFSNDWEVYRDYNGKLMYCSPAVERVLGYTVEEYFQDKPLSYYIHPEDADIAQKNLNRLIQGEDVRSETYRVIKKDGSIIYLEFNSQLVITEEGVYQGYRLSGRDVTEKVLLEQKLRKLNETKDKFFSIISHDLRSPFNILLGFSELLQDDSENISDEERTECISHIYSTSKETLELLENLLVWSRSQSGDLVLNKSKIELKSASEKILSLASSAAKKKDIHIVNLVDQNIFVEADVNMLHSILRNLFSNAIKFTNNSGTITLEAKEKNDFVEISVSDNGIGIAEDVKQNMFTSESNLSNCGKEYQYGTGLGLVLCKEFVEENGGKIWVESELGKGSTFRFTIPIFK